MSSDGAAGIGSFHVTQHHATSRQFLHFGSVVYLSPPPGATVDIDLEVFVNRSTAPDLNSGKEQIEEILVLHLERGKDYFISVTGNYLPSCFGTPIRSLCQMREPIQDVPAEILRKLVTTSTRVHPHLLLCSHPGSPLDSALLKKLSCFFASSLRVRLDTCGGVFKAADCRELVGALSLCRLSKLPLLSTAG